MSKQTNNKAGAKYGVGYCDAQCARDLKFVGGKVRLRPRDGSILNRALTPHPRPTLRAGLPLQMMPTRGSGHTVVVAPKSTCGTYSFRIPNSLCSRLTSPCLYRESNSHSFALTPHPCTENTYHVCEKDSCGGTYSEDRFAGKCDANGCDYNPYRMGQKDFYGKGKTVDTSKKFT